MNINCKVLYCLYTLSRRPQYGRRSNAAVFQRKLLMNSERRKGRRGKNLSLGPTCDFEVIQQLDVTKPHHIYEEAGWCVAGGCINSRSAGNTRAHRKGLRREELELRLDRKI